jgi:hypothetical protein
MDKANKPYIIEFPKIGAYTNGYISIAEGNTLPITVQRVYWTYYTPEEIIRGKHAHHELEQVLFAAAGKIIVKTENLQGEVETFDLDKPNIGLFIPKLCWRTIQYTHNAVQICLASIEYSEDDYIRDYEDFVKLKG